MKRKIEVFTADCPLCKEALRLVREEACPECEIIERQCSGEECCEPAKVYGIKAVPTIAVDGEIRVVGKPSPYRGKKSLCLREGIGGGRCIL